MSRQNETLDPTNIVKTSKANTRGPLWTATAFFAKAEEEPVLDFLGWFFESGVASYRDMETGRVTVSVYIEDRKLWTDKVPELEKRWGRAFGSPFPAFRLKRVRQQDWAESWKRHFKPMQIGSRVWIRPSWRKVTLRPGQLEVVLDPGLSFGTGQHPTTGFCLREIVRLRRNGLKQSLLDIGTGSGILAITAAKLRYSPVEAFDLDPDAIRVARGNARRNGMGRKIRFSVRDVTDKAGPKQSRLRYDVVCANLLANIIVDNCRRMLDCVAPGGVFIAAGILATEFDSVRKVMSRNGWRLVKRRTEKEWCSGSFVEDADRPARFE